VILDWLRRSLRAEGQIVLSSHRLAWVWFGLGALLVLLPYACAGHGLPVGLHAHPVAAGFKPAARTRVVLLAGALAAAPPPANAADAETAQGYVVQLDAEQRPVIPTPGGSTAAEPAHGSAAGDETAPLVEDAPGGGEMIILTGRLRNNSVAHRDRDSSGGIAVECTQAGVAAGKSAP
jgi:hypothetical protein